MNDDGIVLYAHRIGVDTYLQPIVFIRSDSKICRSEGFELPTRIKIEIGDRSVIATSNIVKEELLTRDKIGLSEYAWQVLDAHEGDEVKLSHPAPLDSLSHVRSKIYGQKLTSEQMTAIINDIADSCYSDVHMSSFITACSGNALDSAEITHLTKAMINVGDRLTWKAPQVFDKHCVGGLPGNRNSLLIVPIVATFGLVIPKTSSRAITSPAGTADTMEVLAPVQLSLDKIQKVVEQENGCIVWGGEANLSPADDILIRVERVLNLDNEGQLVASVLSKKVSAGSTHVVIDIPIGPTAKVRTIDAANRLKQQFELIAKQVGINIQVIFTDGTQPVGRGIGPALEARDILAVLQCKKDAPQDLRERALMLAGEVLELSSKVVPGSGIEVATEILNSGKAWHKFQEICRAQGGLFEPPVAKYVHTITAPRTGIISLIDNRRLATLAKLAGAPRAKAAGIELHASVSSSVEQGQPLFTIHSEAPGELQYAVDAIKAIRDIMKIEEQ